MRRGKMNEARNVAIYLTRKVRRDTLKEVGLHFNVDNDSTISSVIERIQKRLKKDRTFSRRLAKIEKTIRTS